MAEIATQAADSKTVSGAKTEFVTPAIKLPTESVVDSGAMSRHQRLQKIMSDLGDAEDKEISEKRKAASAKDEAAEEPEEKPSQAEAASEFESFNKADETESEAERKEKRRQEVEKAETGSVAKEEDEAATEEGPAKQEAKPEKDLDKERKAKFEKVLAMEAKAQKDREKLRDRELIIQRREADLEGKAKSLDSQYQKLVTDFRRDVDIAQNILKLARENPLELLERAGARPEDVAKWIQNASDPVTQRLKEMDQRWEELQRREAESRRRDQEAAKARELHEARQKIENEFLGHFEEKTGEDYSFEPARLIYSRSEMLRLGNEIAEEAYKNGYTFTSRDIAEAVNALAEDDERYKTIQKRLSKVVASDNKPSKADTSTSTATPAKPAAAKPASTPKASTTVLSNQAAQESSRTAKPQGENPNYKRDREQRLKRVLNGLE